MICIALDAMGGDHGPSVIVPACLDALAEYPQLEVILVGDISQLTRVLKEHSVTYDPATAKKNRLHLHHASEQVLMDESPATAMRTKKDSSMRVAINLVKEGQANACVSAGNTGALMAIARFVLKTIPGIDRPAIVYSMPVKVEQEHKSHMRMLDLGANVDCTGEHLFQFAVMGSVLAQTADNIPHPRVALLNIGSEDIKGTEAVKMASQLLNETKVVNYTGFIEGTDLYKGEADVVVCDGFVGNVALKTSEGITRMLVSFIKKQFTQSFYNKIIGFLALPILRKMQSKLDISQYNGATLIGLNGIVIKSHGNALRKSFKQAVIEAMRQSEQNTLARLRHEVELHLSKRSIA